MHRGKTVCESSQFSQPHRALLASSLLVPSQGSLPPGAVVNFPFHTMRKLKFKELE